MHDAPDISIVVPCYNVAETLSATIANIQAQTHTNWEAVCVDDESNDETRKLLAAYSRQDARIRWIFARHGGLAKTRNCGVYEAWAPHVLFLDADDILRPDALATLLRASAEDPDAIVAGGYELLDADANPLAIYRFPNVPEFTVDTLLRGNRFSVTTLVPRSLLGEQPFDEEMTTACEDWNLWLNLASRGVKCLTVPRVIFGYRLRAESLGHTSDLAYASGRQALERWLPHARDREAVRDVLHRWAANCGARAFVSGEKDAISRYFDDLPPLDATEEFAAAVASSIRAAHEFMSSAADFSPRGSQQVEIRDWLCSGPLSDHADAILDQLNENNAEPRDFIARASEFLGRRPDARRVLIYGLGTNGSTLLEQLCGDSNASARELCIADDHASALTFDLHGLSRDDPRQWKTWPAGTVAIVTPNESRAMCETLRRAGGCDDTDFIVLSDTNTGAMSRSSQSRVLRFSTDAGPRGLKPAARRECERPDVSIIVACYNAADTVADTIASVQAQTHANWELICVDDESSDRTPEILASLSDSDQRICWERAPHQGQPATKNRGVPLARADHVLFLDADDILRPDALEVLLNAAKRVDENAIIAGGYELLDSGGRPLSIYRFPTVREFSIDEFLRANRISVVSLVPRRLLGEAPFDETLETCIDWDLWLRLAHGGAHCVTAPRVIFGYRLHAHSLSRKVDTVYKSGRAVIKRWLPHASDPAGVRDVRQRWAVAQGAMAFASGSPDAIHRYFADLPPVEFATDFPLAVANSLHYALQFVRGANGAARCNAEEHPFVDVEAWLRSGPLAPCANDIIAEFHRISSVTHDELDRVREFLTTRPEARRLLIYGLGTNGVTLLERLRNDQAARSHKLIGADDHAADLAFELLGLRRDDPRRWHEWPENTIAVITPNDFAAMRATLLNAGGREGVDFLILTAGVSPDGAPCEKAEVLA